MLALQTTIMRTEDEIELLQEYRTRLIADVVTGKLDVRDAAAALPDELDEDEPLDEISTGDEEDAEAEMAETTGEIEA
jgi:type I restriction enzyme S subunit